jgi:hypothetical protein
MKWYRLDEHDLIPGMNCNLLFITASTPDPSPVHLPIQKHWGRFQQGLDSRSVKLTEFLHLRQTF